MHRSSDDHTTVVQRTLNYLKGKKTKKKRKGKEKTAIKRKGKGKK